MSVNETERTMHPRIAELIDVLDATRSELQTLVASLTPEQRTAPARDDQWSVAQILEHLSKVEDGGGRVVSKLGRAAEAAGEQELEHSSVLDLNSAYDIESNPRRIAAPDLVAPTEGIPVEEAMARLEQSRAKLKEVLQRVSGLALGTVTFPHPVFGPFNTYQWVLSIVQHERRHLRQLRYVAGHSEAPAPHVVSAPPFPPTALT